MKLERMIITLILIAQSSFGQTYNTEKKSFTKDDSISKQTTLVTKTSEMQSSPEEDLVSYSKEEWRIIKHQIKTNKNNILSSKEGIHTRKILDTIHLLVPSFSAISQIKD